MDNFKKKLFSYTTFAKIFGHIFIVMEPKIFYHKLLEKHDKQEKADKFGFKAVKKWAKFVVKTAKVDITVEGLEKYLLTVLFSLHQITRVMLMFLSYCTF